MKKVNVILSTYNGERYLREQLESIIAQTYDNITIWIRDDGSSDHTVEIVKEYCQLNLPGKRFCFIEDNLGNLGHVKSFFQVVFNADPADFYAFCDQDDVWLPEKIQRAVDFLDSVDSNQCALYASGYDVCDANLNYIGECRKPRPFSQLNLGRAFYNYGAGLGQGFTLAFNHKMKEVAFQPEHNDIRGQDVWLWAVVTGLQGVYYYDDYSSAKYRRHGDTVTATGKGKIQMWKSRFQYFLDVSFFQRVSKAIANYRIMFYDQMTKEEDRLFLDTFGHYETFGKNRLRKAFYPHRLKVTWPEELATRFAFLCGRA